GEGDVALELVVELGLDACVLGVGDHEVVGRPAVELGRIPAHGIEPALLDVAQDLRDTGAQLVGGLRGRRVGRLEVPRAHVRWSAPVTTMTLPLTRSLIRPPLSARGGSRRRSVHTYVANVSE